VLCYFTRLPPPCPGVQDPGSTICQEEEGVAWPPGDPAARSPFLDSLAVAVWVREEMTVEEAARPQGRARGHGGKDQFPVGMRVLAVDDDPTCLKLLEGLLRRCQYHGSHRSYPLVPFLPPSLPPPYLAICSALVT
jgi:hypothetical protein